MSTYTLAAGLLMSLAMSCHAASIGVVSIVGKNVEVHTLSKLLPDDKVRIQYLDRNHRTHCCIALKGSSFVSIAQIPTASDNVTGDPLFGYRLEGPLSPLSRQPFVGAALVGGKAIRALGPTTLQVDSAKGPLLVKTCLSHEGMHVTAQANHKVLEDLYWGFDYGIAHPTCH
jgi:hypothetical protein